MKQSLKLALVAASALLLANQAQAGPMNLPPPVGPVVQDLAGTAIPHSYTQYTTPIWTATSSMTNISFAFREDPAFLILDDVTMHDVTTSTAVTVVNGGFESGIVGDNAPVGWTYLNMFGASFAGVVANNASSGEVANSGTNFYYDGAVQAYDGITQGIATTSGDMYTISYFLYDDGPLTTFSQLSTNGDVTDTGGNGADLLVYAGAIPTASTPEPTSLLLAGICGACFLGYRLRRRMVAVAAF